MAEAQLCGLLQDEFTCSLCMDILTDPVSIPCGHSFCLVCLTDCWDDSQVCRCPQCIENFTVRPELHINTVLNEVVKKLQKVGLRSPPFQNYAGPGDVKCDFCIGKKFRAVKSCLTCPASYCQTHLQPHFEIAAWKDHKLTDPDENLKEKFSAKHQKSPEIFCKTDETCICSMSVVTGHENHEMAELETDREEKVCNVGISSSILTNLILQGQQTEGYPAETLSPDWFLLIVSVVQRHPVIFFCLFSDFCPLTLDINTAHKDLHLSEGNKKVTCERTQPEYPDHPDRFDYWEQVLCREALTGTRSYWEVECTGDWVLIGVAYKGLSRKGKDLECSFGSNNKSWSLLCADSQYAVRHNDEETEISAPYSPRIGVYLDWPAGSLSFYSVSHTMTLLHRFNTSFTEPLYPGFGFCADPLCVCSLGSK
uniref:Uncharacterized protein n=1 Tax=Erpetoichthys calabaricus TaxID=27687 RepID=A0A8C4T9L9_ERPCA